MSRWRVVRLFAVVLRRLEALAGSRRGAAVLFVVALADFVVQAVAWPMSAGPNLVEYLLTYIQLLDRHPLLPWAPLYRGPGTGIVVGPLLDFAGGALAEPVAAVLFAISVVAWSAAASLFGRRAAILTACALLLYPGYGDIFHELASEIVMATVFALWALAFTRAALRPSARGFVVAGLAMVWLVLIRPGNAVIVPLALFPLLLAGGRRTRLCWTAASVAAACLPLAAWTLQNGWRYGDYTLARGGDAAVPFYRVFVTDKLLSPNDGPAARRLAAAIQQHLLTRNPYKGYHVTLTQVYAGPNARVEQDLFVLSDQVWGWNSAYSTLGDAALEAIDHHKTTFASDVANTVWQLVSGPNYSSRVPHQTSPPTPRIALTAQRLPKSNSGQLIPGGQRPWISRPDQSIREVWTSPTTHKFVATNPKQLSRFHQIRHDLSTLLSNFPKRSASGWLQLRLNALAHWYPPPIFWLAVALLALAIRRPRRKRILIVPAIAAFLILILNALSHAGDRYMLPTAPAFILLGAAALLSERRALHPGASERSPSPETPNRHQEPCAAQDV